MITAARIESAVYHNLQRAQVLALVPTDSHTTTRPDYWERAWIVAWERPVSEHQPSPDNNGMVYGTHRVHVNSNGDSACFDGHYDLTRERALASMVERAHLVRQAPGPTVDRAKLAEIVDEIKLNGDADTDVYIAAIQEVLNVTSNEDDKLALWFTPEAIREHFEGDADQRTEWVEAASDEQLVKLGEYCLSADPLYREFHRLLRDAVDNQIEEESK